MKAGPKEKRPCTEPRECKSCLASIWWVVWPKSGKRMPVELDPTGDLVVTHRKALDLLEVAKAGREVAPGRNRYSSHFGKCPGADERRRGTP